MLVPTGAEGKYEYDPSIPAGSGGGGGGGGGGDVSLAKLTLINSAEGKYYEVSLNYADSDIGAMVTYIREVASSRTFEIPLYKGKAFIDLSCFSTVDEQTMPTWDGGVNLDFEHGKFVVTGDGSITMAGTGTIG